MPFRLPLALKARLRPAILITRRVRRERPSLTDIAWARPLSFSQFGEDVWLANHFKEQTHGFYVDVGAFHPFMGSNTRLLYKRGWRGINVEPAPEHLANLVRHRQNDINLPYAVSTIPGPVAFTLAGSFGGIDDETHLWSGIDGPRITVQARPLADILDEHLPRGQTIDLLDVDCEGRDLDVLRSNDWDRYRPRVVLVEHHDGVSTEAPGAFLEDCGYVLATRLDLTLVFVPNAVRHL